MPSSERPGEKKGGASERRTGKEGEEGRKGGRRGEGVVCRIPLSSTGGDHSIPRLLIDRHNCMESAANRDG